MFGHGSLKGKKTYIVAALAVVTAVGAYLTGDISPMEAGQAVLTAILGATIRNGIATETSK